MNKKEEALVDLELPEPGKVPLIADKATKQFDFSRNWRKRIKPLLNDPLVEKSLALGMTFLDHRYRPGMPPCLFGRLGHLGRPNTVSWYQPEGRCHHIAPFAWALGRRLYPTLNWGFLSGPLHTVVIGSKADWKHSEWVMDILNFRELSATQSLSLAQVGTPAYYESLERYASSFCETPEQAYEFLTAKPLPI